MQNETTEGAPLTGGPVDRSVRLTVEELREVCDLTVKLVQLRQNECKHLSVENIAPSIFKSLLDELRDHKIGLVNMSHWSDCAMHNEPAYPNGPCDCGGFRAA